MVTARPLQVFPSTAFAFNGSAEASVANIAAKNCADENHDGRGRRGYIATGTRRRSAHGPEIVDGTKYFWYHHTRADTIDKIDASELNQCVAALAVMSYAIAESPDGLKR